MSFLEHLEELRWTLIRSVLALLFFSILAFIFKKIIFDGIILLPKYPDFISNRLLCELGTKFNLESLCINTKPLSIINVKMSGQFSAHIMVSFYTGIILGFPYLIYELWKFIKPALLPKERKYGRTGIFSVSLLFFTGVMFGYFVIFPISIQFFSTYNVSEEIANQIFMNSYISLLASICLAGGITFELPVLILILTRIGLVTPEFLKRYRKHAIILILIVSAVITPPDIFSQILVSIPLIILYEVSILVSKRIVRRKKNSPVG